MKSKLTHLLICLLCFVSAFAAAQDGYVKEYYVKDGDTLNLRVLYPDNFNAKQEYPVVLFLHGSGERGNDNEKQLVHGSKMFLDKEFRQQYPTIAIFPQCPRDDYWSNVDVDRDGNDLGLTFPEDGEPTPVMKLLLSFMDSVTTSGYTDKGRIYVAGLSMGGMGTFEILSRRPKMFNAAVPICGGGSTKAASKYASNVRLWVFHGAKDNVVLPSFSTEMVIALTKAGADVKYTLYKNANHNSWDSAFKEPELFSWLFSTE